MLWAGLRVAMWIAHVGGGKFHHGLLEESLRFSSQRTSRILGPHFFFLSRDVVGSGKKIAAAAAERIARFWCTLGCLLVRPSEHQEGSRGRKRHINIWHINYFSVTPVTDPGSRPGTRFLPVGCPDENVYVPWVPHTAHKLLTPGHRSGDPWPPRSGDPPRPGSHRENLFMFMCLFLS